MTGKKKTSRTFKKEKFEANSESLLLPISDNNGSMCAHQSNENDIGIYDGIIMEISFAITPL